MNFQTSNFEFLRNKSSTKPFFKLKFTEKKKRNLFLYFSKKLNPSFIIGRYRQPRKRKMIIWIIIIIINNKNRRIFSIKKY